MTNKFKNLSCPIRHPAEIKVERALKLFKEICASCYDCRYEKCPGYPVKRILEGKE